MANDLGKILKVAQAADRAYSAAVKAAGFKSRWDMSAAAKAACPAVMAAYNAKVAADQAMHEALRDLHNAEMASRVGV